MTGDGRDSGQVAVTDYRASNGSGHLPGATLPSHTSSHSTTDSMCCLQTVLAVQVKLGWDVDRPLLAAHDKRLVDTGAAER